MSLFSCYFIILVQSAIDSAVGLFGIPLYLAYMLGQMGVHSNCIVIILGHTTTVLIVEISTIVQSALTLERYIAGLHPFAYKMADKKTNLGVCMYCFSRILLCNCHSITRLPQVHGWMDNGTINRILFLHRIFLHKNILGREKVGSFSKKCA